ncbi:MAG: hypothetical protein K1000chlam3_00993 [Chlamydiae bacterium]|nr:hypothetical protein [Chlamydiota bacterium]
MGRAANFDQINILNVLYPPSCIACNALLEKNTHFCSHCQEEFTLLPEEGHCVKCFAEISMIRGTCKPCRKVTHPFRKLAACFDSYGPGKSLLRTFLQEKNSHLAKDIASYIVVQLHQLSFPSFGAIIVLPKRFQHPFTLVAKEVAKMLEVPFVPILKRRFASKNVFSVKKKWNIINKGVLLLDTEMQERTEIRSAGWALKERLPETIYGMTFCATLHS